jgi:hypothetical protein
MKKLSVMILLFAASLAAQTYAGIWNGTGGIESAKYGVIPQSAQITLLQAGTSLQGTFKLGNAKPLPITSGTVSGNQLTLVVAKGVATGTFTASGGQLQGSMTSSSGEVINFVFKPQ